MSLCEKRCSLSRSEPDYAFLNRLSLAIAAYRNDKGNFPAAILMDYNYFWKSMGDERCVPRPGYIVEFEGVRVIPTSDLDRKFYLVPELVEVPDVILLEDV